MAKDAKKQKDLESIFEQERQEFVLAAKKFFEEAFEKISKKPEVYDGETWKLSKLEMDMEFFVAKSLDKIYPSETFPEIIENPHSFKATLNITAEPFLRKFCSSCVDQIFEEKIKKATKDNWIETISAYEICGQMTKYACDQVFELERNRFEREKRQKQFDKNKQGFESQNKHFDKPQKRFEKRKNDFDKQNRFNGNQEERQM